MLWSLPKKWEPKVATLEEAKDLSKDQAEVYGSLQTHEFNLTTRDDNDKKKKAVAFKMERSSSEESDSNGESVTEEEIVMLSRKFNKFFKNRRFMEEDLIKKGQV